MVEDKPLEKLRIAFATPEFVTEDYFDGGLANYLNRVGRILAELGHDVHVVTLSLRDESEFEHEGVMVHRLKLKDGWQTLNRFTGYSFPNTLHWLNFGTQVPGEDRRQGPRIGRRTDQAAHRRTR